MSQCPYCGDDPGLQIAERWDIKLAEKWPSIQQLGPRRTERLQQHYHRMFSTAYIGRPWLEPAYKPRRVTLTRLWGRGCKARLVDYLVAGAEPLLNALHNANLVTNGNANELLHICQAKALDGQDLIHVRIEEIL